MESVRIIVRDSSDDKTLTILDNGGQDSLHYTNDSLTRYIEGDASVLMLDVLKPHDDTRYLTVGAKLAFVWKKKDYWLTINDTTESETKISITAYSLSLEMNNEQQESYEAPRAMSFLEYLRRFDPESTLKLNVNEISDKKIQHEWSGESNTLSRLYSLATVFSAELEFVTVLNKDYSLKEIKLNVYKKHDDNNQGMGKNRTGYTLRLGKEIKTITKKESIENLFTAITPIGKDDMFLIPYDKTVHDKYGNVEYSVWEGVILATQARDRFPSSVNKSNDRYINKTWKTDYTNKDQLYGAALAELKKGCVPEVEYEVDGYFDTDPGDTVTLENDRYKPVLILEARVAEQTESFTQPSRNKTTFSNYRNIGSQISNSLINRMNQLIAANKKYEYQIFSTNGTVFKNGVGSTTLSARVLDGVNDITSRCSIKWFKDNVVTGVTTRSFTVNASDIDGYSVYRYEATLGTKVGGFESTVTNVNDGSTGKDGNGIKSTVIKYAVSQSGTVSPTDESEWFESPPNVNPGWYLWTRTTHVYDDNKTTNSYSVTKNGSDGVGIRDRITFYLTTNQSNGITINTDGWEREPTNPSASAKYLWSFTKTYLTNNTEMNTTPTIIGNYAAPGTPGTPGENGTALFGSSTTAATEQTKVVTAVGATRLYAGLTIAVHFANANTYVAGAIKLNVNNLGAKDVYVDNQTITGANNQMRWATNSMVTFMYGGTGWIVVDNPKTWNTTSATAAGTAAKVATVTGIVIVKGTTVAVQFSAANTAANPTLNISGLGAVAVYNNGARNAYWSAGSSVLFTFTGNSWYVSNNPVYASTAIIGNSAGKNAYVDANGFYIRNGGTVVSSFKDNEIILGTRSTAADATSWIRFLSGTLQSEYKGGAHTLRVIGQQQLQLWPNNYNGSTYITLSNGNILFSNNGTQVNMTQIIAALNNRVGFINTGRLVSSFNNDNYSAASRFNLYTATENCWVHVQISANADNSYIADLQIGGRQVAYNANAWWTSEFFPMKKGQVLTKQHGWVRVRVYGMT